MRKNFFNFILIGISSSALSLSSCSSNSEEPYDWDEVSKDITLSARSQEAANDLDGFYLRLTKDMAEYVDSDNELETKNFVISPLSASFVLSMIANGIEIEDQQELISYLGVDDLPALNQLASQLLCELPSLDPKTWLTLSNSAWFNNIYQLNQNYFSLLNDNYACDINYLDVNQPESGANQVNRWINSKLNSNDLKFVAPSAINSNFIFFIFNVLSFKSEWRIKNMFDQQNTDQRPFDGLNSGSTVQMMKAKGKQLNCFQNEYVKYASIPFGNDAYHFEIIVPQNKSDILDLPLWLVDNLSLIRNSVEVYNSATIWLPRFNVTSKLDWTQALSEAGLNTIGGDTSLKMFTKDVKGHILFRQYASFEVDEKGAKAEAVSQGGAVETAPEPRVIEIKADRPFMFFITERSTGACVVAGRITDL